MEQTSAEKQAPLMVGVRFTNAGKVYEYDPGRLALEQGDQVIVATERGTALGTVAVAPRSILLPADATPPQRVIKKADSRDMARLESQLQRAHQAARVFRQRVRELGLRMKLIKTECVFDGAKIIFWFAAEERIDFRQLVRDLAHTLHTRIEMKQIGARDEAKMVGAIGPCGRELCCSTWLTEFHPVSVKMAKEQGLSLNPSKLAGMCGRLKCCLRYEFDTYLELGRGLPSLGKRVVSVKGDGQVVRHNTLKQTVVVKRDEDGLEMEASLDDLVAKKPS